ncbi:MAG: DUF488 family protein, partial [Candidatus Aminicenantales bacterium]
KSAAIQVVADVRAFPSSARHPQYNRETLEENLRKEGLFYIWLGRELGGYRREEEGLGPASPNRGWRSGGFRVYADIMLTEAFGHAVDRLLGTAARSVTAILCAEKFYWRCHRLLISDYLLARGHEVRHIIDRNRIRNHRLTRFARIRDGILTYPPEETLEKA